MDWPERIEAGPDVCFGRPRIAGTRISVEFLIARFAERWNHQQVLSSYPQLELEDLQAAFALGTEMLSEEDFVISAKLRSPPLRRAGLD